MTGTVVEEKRIELLKKLCEKQEKEGWEELETALMPLLFFTSGCMCGATLGYQLKFWAMVIPAMLVPWMWYETSMMCKANNSPAQLQALFPFYSFY